MDKRIWKILLSIVVFFVTRFKPTNFTNRLVDKLIMLSGK